MTPARASETDEWESLRAHLPFAKALDQMQGEKTADKDVVNEQVDEIRRAVAGISTVEIKNGEWFAKLLRLPSSPTRRKCPGVLYEEVPRIACRRGRGPEDRTRTTVRDDRGRSVGRDIHRVDCSDHRLGGGASPLTLPVAATTFTVDLLYVSRLQIRLAYDLAVIYRAPIDIDDAEDLYDLLRVAFGIKAGKP